MLANPDEAIKLVKTIEPLTNEDIEKQRMLYTAKNLMVTPETAKIGIGDLDDKRLAASIAIVAEAYGSRSERPISARSSIAVFLPPRADREIKMPAN